jgi:hypothetical protein
MLTRNRADGRPALLIFDEGQRLSMDLLEEIRLLLNKETPREKLLEIIIAGQPELGEVLARPELRQLKQRVSSICKLKALSIEELHEYMHHRLTHAGLPRQTLFNEECIQLIYEYTQGIPRLVNSLCNGALQTGFAMQSREITPAILAEAARDLELLTDSTTSGGVSEVSAPVHLAAVPRASTSKPVPPKISRAVNGTPESPIPMEGYNTRQKSLGFFSSLMDRWK